jgi:hypothetical protein
MIVTAKVVPKIESEFSAENRLRAIARPRRVEWEMAEPIKAFFLAMRSGEINPHVADKKNVPTSAYNKKS